MGGWRHLVSCVNGGIITDQILVCQFVAGPG
jgi:hypothetical protein